MRLFSGGFRTTGSRPSVRRGGIRRPCRARWPGRNQAPRRSPGPCRVSRRSLLVNETPVVTGRDVRDAGAVARSPIAYSAGPKKRRCRGGRHGRRCATMPRTAGSPRSSRRPRTAGANPLRDGGEAEVHDPPPSTAALSRRRGFRALDDHDSFHAVLKERPREHRRYPAATSGPSTERRRVVPDVVRRSPVAVRVQVDLRTPDRGHQRVARRPAVDPERIIVGRTRSTGRRRKHGRAPVARGAQHRHR